MLRVCVDMLFSVFVCKWQLEPVVFLALTWTLPGEQVHVSDAGGSFVDLINTAKLDWFCLKRGSCCELFCSDPSGRVQVLADPFLFPQELGQTPEMGPLGSPALCHPSWPKSVGAFSCPFAVWFYKCGCQPGYCHTAGVWKCPGAGLRAISEETFKVPLWQRSWGSTQPWVAWPGCVPHIRVISTDITHWGLGWSPCTSGISHCWRRNCIYMPSAGLFLVKHNQNLPSVVQGLQGVKVHPWLHFGFYLSDSKIKKYKFQILSVSSQSNKAGPFTAAFISISTLRLTLQARDKLIHKS